MTENTMQPAALPQSIKKHLLQGAFQGLVPMAGLEPARVAPLPPQDSVSTSSTTSALVITAQVAAVLEVRPPVLPAHCSALPVFLEPSVRQV